MIRPVQALLWRDRCGLRGSGCHVQPWPPESEAWPGNGSPIGVGWLQCLVGLCQLFLSQQELVSWSIHRVEPLLVSFHQLQVVAPFKCTCRLKCLRSDMNRNYITGIIRVFDRYWQKFTDITGYQFQELAAVTAHSWHGSAVFKLTRQRCGVKDPLTDLSSQGEPQIQGWPLMVNAW